MYSTYVVIFYNSIPFFILNLLCGVLDILDGLIARKTNSAGKFGAILDTVADFIFTLVVLIKKIIRNYYTYMVIDLDMCYFCS